MSYYRGPTTVTIIVTVQQFSLFIFGKTWSLGLDETRGLLRLKCFNASVLSMSHDSDQ